MIKFMILASLLFSQSVFADLICVRNYATPQFDICSVGTSPKHVYIVSQKDPTAKICTMTYDDQNCKFHKQEFSHARTATGKIVCVVNFNQPDVTGNYCALDPASYRYALDPWL